MAQATDNLSTIRDFIRWGVSRFNQAELYYGHGTDNALDEAVFIVLHALHLPMDFSTEYFDCCLTSAECSRVAGLIERRIERRVPAAYLTHEMWFAGLSFYVNENVLVPRSPIAELIEEGFEPWIQSDQIGQVLDLCTGSGCIAIACAAHLPEARVDAVDISPEALEVTATNIERHQIAERVEAIESDLFGALGGKKYDLIVSNPPYVSLEEMSTLPEEYHQEPRLGLEAGTEGLDIVERILDCALNFLEPNGILVIEVGNSEDALIQRYPNVPFLWVDFERGGEGIFVLTYEQLEAHQADLKLENSTV